MIGHSPFEWDKQRTWVLDGALGTELQRRGVELPSPLWSTSALLFAPETVMAIHSEYVDVGADIITANTFRTHARNLAPTDQAGQARHLTEQAVRLARAAAQRATKPVFVAGSQSPLEDCYRPDRTPMTSALIAEHREHARNLADAGVDLILIETQTTIREAYFALSAAGATNLPVLLSFHCGNNGRLLSGELLEDALKEVLPLTPEGILINCTPAPHILSLLLKIKMAIPETTLHGAYANTGEFDKALGWRDTVAASPQSYAEYARAWLKSGARIVGGCCGTTPQHIKAVREQIEKTASGDSGTG